MFLAWSSSKQITWSVLWPSAISVQ